MNNNSQIENLPKELKKQVLKYLTLKDILSLEACSRTLFNDISNENEVWAEIMEREFVNNQGFSSLDRVPKNLINFRSIEQPRNVIKMYVKSNTQFTDLIKQLVNDQDAFAINNLLNSLSNPDIPIPILKKQTQFFQTQTTFQNFLTEVKFGVKSPVNVFSDATQAIKRLSEQISIYNMIPEDILLCLRWYKVDNINKMQTQENDIKSGKLSQTRNKSIKKSKTTNAVKRTTTKISKNQNKSQPPKNKKLTKEKKSEIKQYENSPSLHEMFDLIRVGSPSFDSSNNQDYFGTLSTPSSLFSDDLSDLVYYRDNTKEINNGNNTLISIFQKLQQVISSYCQINLSYLKSFNSSIGLLNEYQRIWRKFALAIIELNSYLYPLADKLNQLHDNQLPNHPSFPNFSIWRFMVKTWVKEVFNPLNDALFQAFRLNSFKLRVQGNQKLATIVNGLKQNSNVSILEQIFGEQSFLYNFEDLNMEINDLEEASKLLKGFYDSICDFSFNEYSVFYWDCLETSSTTSKATLDQQLIRDNESIFQVCLNIVGSNYGIFLEAIEIDQQFGQIFMIDELHCQMIKNLVSKMDDFNFNKDFANYQDKFFRNAQYLEEHINELRNERQRRSFELADQKYDPYFINEAWPGQDDINDCIREKLCLNQEQLAY